MIPTFDPAGLKRPKLWEHALRFLFGGAVAVAAALIGKRLGPNAGGLFLAFPAILPASITLVKDHEGRAKATDDARGARIGALALMSFAAVTFLLREHGAALTLISAVLIWFAVALLGWMLVYGRQPK
jgi:hypothetical protein